MGKIITLITIAIIFSGCSTVNVQPSSTPAKTSPTTTTENENLLTYQNEELGISMQYPARFGKANETEYKDVDLLWVHFIDDNGNKTGLSLESTTLVNGNLPISNEKLTELPYGPANLNNGLECDNFPEGGFTGGEVMIIECEELNANNRQVVILTETITAAGYGHLKDDKRAILQTKKGLWTLIAPEQDLSSIIQTLQYK